MLFRSIMRNREVDCRSYRLEVRNENLNPCFEILFASVDESLDHLPDDFRTSIIEGARRMASLKETIGGVSDTLNNVRETLKEAEKVLVSLR